MGLINVDEEVEAAFAEAGSREKLPDDTYEGVVVNATVGESKVPWMDASLTVRLQTDDGFSEFVELEIAPLTNRDGELHQGKLKFLKWQLGVLGYGGRLSDLEESLLTLLNTRVEFEVSSRNSDKINSKTGEPYVNRDVKLTKNLGKDAVIDDVY